mgnify:CR=1 FL=1
MMRVTYGGYLKIHYYYMMGATYGGYLKIHYYYMTSATYLSCLVYTLMISTILRC